MSRSTSSLLLAIICLASAIISYFTAAASGLGLVPVLTSIAAIGALLGLMGNVMNLRTIPIPAISLPQRKPARAETFARIHPSRVENGIEWFQRESDDAFFIQFGGHGAPKKRMRKFLGVVYFF